MAGVKVKVAGTGEVVEVDSASAQRGLERGQFVPDNAQVQLSRGKEIGEVAPDKLANALAQGWQVASADEQAAVKLRAEESGVVGSVRGGAEAVARGVTLGLSDAALGALGADTSRMDARRQELGAGGIALELAGGLLGGGAGLVGKGAVTAGRVARAARYTPAALAARAGAKAGAGLKGAGAARAGLSLGVEGAVEGAIQGAGQVIGDSYLQDKPLTAESIVAGAGMGAGLGGLFGGALGVGGSTLVSAVGGAGRKAGALLRSAPDAVDGLQGAAISASAREKVIKGWAKISGVDEGALTRSIDRLGTQKGAERMIGDLAETREKVARSLKVGVDDANEAWDDLIRTTGGDARIGNAERLMTGAENAVAPRHADEFLRRESQRVDELLGDELLTKQMRRDLKEIKRHNEVAQRTIRERGSGAEAFRAVDRYKQDVATIARGRADEFARGAVREAGEAAKLSRSFDDAAKGHLFDESIYGAAGKAHRESNQAWANAIEAAGNLRKKDPKVGALFKRGADEADLDTMLRLARKYTRAGGETKVSAFDDAIDARLNAVKKLRENNDITPEVSAKIDQFETSVKKMRSELKEQSEHASAVDDMWKLRQAETNGSPSQSVFSTAGPMIAGMMGSAFGGPIGGAFGAIAGHITAPSRVLRAAASLRGVVDKVNFDIGGAVASFGRLADGAKAAAVRARVPDSRTASRAVRTYAMSQASKDKRDAELKRTIKSVEQYASQPMMLADALQDEGLDALDSEVSGRALAVAARATQFLQGKRPSSYKPTFGGGAELFDPIEMDRYERFVEAVTRPLAAASRLGEGTMTVEHAEALKFVYPMLYAKLQSSIWEELGEREAMGKPIDFAARVQLGVLGDMPADDSLRPFNLVSIANVHGTAPPQQSDPMAAPRGGGIKSVDLEMKSVQTDQARLALGGTR